MATILRILTRAAPVFGWLVLAAGVLLQAWLKDRNAVSAFFFYAMPKPCLAALAVALVVWPAQRRAARWPAVGAAAGMLAWWLALSWGGGTGLASLEKAGPELKVLYWNLCRPSGLDEEMVEMVNRYQPDLAAFVEPGPNANTLAAEYQKRLPGYTVTYIPRGILWVSRIPSGLKKRGKLQGMGAFAAFEVTGAGAAFPLIVADVLPHPLVSREPQLREALEQAHDRDDAIMVGDFNTPSESLFFDPYRKLFANALDEAGSGLRETWPVGLPLLSLDHVWAGRSWTVTRAEKMYVLRGSDHAALLVTLRR